MRTRGGHVVVGPSPGDEHPDRRAILFQNGKGHAGHRLPQESFLQGGEAKGGPCNVYHREGIRDLAHRAQSALR